MKGHTFGLTAFLLVLGSLAPTRLEAQSDDLIKGERVWFKKQPSWTHSGAWGPRDTLILADVLRSELKVYAADGSYEGKVTGQLTKPMVVHPASGQQGPFWVEDEDGRFVLLDSRNRIQRTVNLEELAKGPEGDLRAVYQWTPLRAGEFLIFGDIVQGDHGTSAFLTVPIDHPERVQVLAQIGLDDPARRFYLLGMPYVASIGEVPYYLVMDGEPYLASPGRQRLTFTLRKDQQVISRPQLPEERGRLASKAIFQALEESTLLAGLYGWHGHLYVLVRTPASQGRTLWEMLKLDPVTGRRIWKRQVDSTANHLTVVPGEKYWAFIEKGRVEEAGLQEIPSFLRVPAKQLDR